MSDELATARPPLPSPATFDDLLELGLGELRNLLGPRWRLEKRTPSAAETSSMSDDSFELIIDIADPSNSAAQVLVECKMELTPAQALKVLEVQRRTLRNMYSEFSTLVIAPWLDARTREILETRGVGYVDLTGNINLKLERPGLVVIKQGAQQDPNPRRPESQRRLSGQRALRLIRLLIDVEPPYKPIELTEASGLSAGYVSRLLDVMQRQALINRKGRIVTSVDWPALTRARASESRLLDLENVSAIAPNGVFDVLEMIDKRRSGNQLVAVTGSYALGSVGPVSIGGQLMLYVRPQIELSQAVGSLGLIPASSGEVILLKPGDGVVFERMRDYQGLPLVGLSQLAIDCMSGPGRMPADGEQVLRFMIENERSWRARDIQSLLIR